MKKLTTAASNTFYINGIKPLVITVEWPQAVKLLKSKRNLGIFYLN